MAEDSIEVFFSYSHKDEALRDELATHLRILERQKVISAWHDRRILPGEEWDHQIDTRLESADMILLLISADFLASNYCWDVEVARAMQRHEANAAVVIPIILRRCDWTSAPFARLQALPKNAQAITSWGDRDAALEDVTQGIRKAAQRLLEAKKQKAQQFQQAASTQISQKKTQQYRQEAEQLIQEDNGEISSISRVILDTLRNSLGLSVEEVDEIEQEILKPYTIRKVNLQQYEQVLQAALQQENPLRESTLKRLIRLQIALQLTDEDVTEVSEKFKVDYTRLNDLLAAKMWREADYETCRLMLQIVRREEDDWIREEEVKSFPCKELVTIDRLWVQSSHGHFGFSIQKRIWLDPNINGEWQKFKEAVGWCNEKGELKKYDNLVFSLEAPAGHFPRWVITRLGGIALGSSAFIAKLTDCNV